MAADELEQVRAGLKAQTVPAGEPEVALFRRWTMAELLAADRTFRWTVRGLLVQNGYGMIGGAKKSLKSHVGDFVDVGIATGLPIFGHFEVDEVGPVVVYVGEGGRVPCTRRLERVAAAMGVRRLAEVPLEPTFDMAPIGSCRFEESLRRDLDEVGPVHFHLDPWYAYHPAAQAVNASNLYEEGALLARLSAKCVSAGASCLVTNHFNKTGSGAGLDRITQAGGGEWSDSWLLLSHRKDPDVGRGLFYLTLDIGSRQWGGATWDLDMDLGRFDPELGEYDGAITWDLHRAGSTAPAPRGRLLEIVSAQPWSLSREPLAKALGGSLAKARQAVDQATVLGEIASRQVSASRRNGRPYQVTVYGPPTFVQGERTNIDEGSAPTPLRLVTGLGTFVQGADDD